MGSYTNFESVFHIYFLSQKKKKKKNLYLQNLALNMILIWNVGSHRWWHSQWMLKLLNAVKRFAIKSICSLDRRPCTVPCGCKAAVPSDKDSVASMCTNVITKTHLFKYTENFSTKKWRFSDKTFWYFSFCSKHRFWVLVRTASSRRL